MATVLLTAIAATIALVLVRETVLVTRAQTVRGDYDLAYQRALDVKRDLERQLAADPSFYLKTLFRYEVPRVCVLNGVRTAILPPEDPAKVDNTSKTAPHDTPWPSSCQTTWDPAVAADGGLPYLAEGLYATTTNDDGSVSVWDPAKHDVKVRLSTPSARDRRTDLVAEIVAKRGQTTAGVKVSYRPSSASTVTAFSQSDLRLDALFTDSTTTSSGVVAVAGTLYSGGLLYLPTTAASFSQAQLMAEGGIVGSVPDGARVYAGTAGSGARDIRKVAPAPLTLEGLRASYAQLERTGCGGADGLCLRFGQTLQASSGPVTVSTSATESGTRPAAYLLKVTAGGALQVWTAAARPTSPGECVIACDVVSLAKADFAAHRHPASDPALDTTHPTWLWQKLGDFPLPDSGVVLTDADTWVGQNPAGISGVSADTAKGGFSPRSPLTVVAGSPSAPRDLVIGTAITRASGATAQPTPLGLVATRSIVVPFYARPNLPGSKGSLSIQANLVSLGYGLPQGLAALRAVPSTVPRQGAATNTGGSLTILGSVAAPALEQPLAGWQAVTVKPDVQMRDTPPPAFPSFASGWVERRTDRISRAGS